MYKLILFGDKYWCNYKYQLHREDGPAIEYANGTKFWYIDGKLHREDGPTAEYAGGEKSWYYNDELIGESWKGFTQEDFERYLKIKEYW